MKLGENKGCLIFVAVFTSIGILTIMILTIYLISLIL